LTKEGSVEKGNGGFVKGDAVYDYLNERESLEIGRNTTKIAMGKDSAAGTDSVAIGNGNDAGKDSVAIGNANKTTGTEKSLALGYQNTISGNQSVALGDSNTVSGNQSVALGDSNTVRGKQSIAIGHGHSVTGDHSGAFGDPATISGNYAFSVGNNNNISGSNSVAIGNDNKISGNKTFVMGNNVDTNASNAVVLGDGSEGVDNAVFVGSSKLGGQRQIKNVAPGEDDTDAATWGQVKDVAQNAYNNAVYLNNSINRMDSKINKVGAGAAALAALHPIEMDNKFGMGIGYGNYRDAHSMALGVFYRPKDNLMFSIGGSMGNGENMVNAGISIALDKGFTNSKAMMARTIKAQGEALDEQRKANAEQEAKNHNLEAENAAIKEQNARLEARLAAIEAKLAK
jgi:autotransporter adhesin